MIILNQTVSGLKGQKLAAHGDAMGIVSMIVRPVRAKALIRNNAFALTGR